MTMRTYITTRTEAREITEGYKRYIFRDKHKRVQKGDIIGFRVVENNRSIKDKIDENLYIVTSIEDRFTAPIDKDLILIGFRDA